MIGCYWAELRILLGFNEVSNEGPVLEEGSDPAMAAHIPVNEEGDDGAQQTGSNHGVRLDISHCFGGGFLELLISVMCQHLHIINL